MSENLSKYKLRRLSTEAFKNGLRLHFDSILLFNNESYPSAFQLSVLAMEEFSKSNWVEHYYSSSITNNGFPDEVFEQKWLKLLYLHPRKQTAFFGWSAALDYSPKFVKFVQDRKLELKKQRATYVGLDKIKSKIDIKSRISIPTKIKEVDAKQMISMINDHLSEICHRKMIQEIYFDLEEKDELITKELQLRLKKWKYKSGLRSTRWFKEWTRKQ
jgi:AbiV family abortive infection protein